MPRTRAEILLDMYGHASYGISRAYVMCMSGMAEKLREACVRGEAERVARFLGEGIKPLPDENGRSPLLLAAALGHTDVCNALLLRETEVNVADSVSV
ncbi:hypothetical protein M0804_000485 [Polistes exclamans]|nr:hypothetical protein M0804_000485 [Polistes exclamans]